MSLEEQVGRMLAERGQTLATAESCTGGLISHRITDIPGSSVYFMGGVASYSNQAKINILGVQESTLITRGAVSDAVAYQMALGALNLFGVDYALSVTGIAGPGGGTADKPVGLTYIGLASLQGVEVQRFVWQGTRSENKLASTDAALNMLLEALS